ncbi:MAG: T9SS type A sorting domain-containing protein, partial [Candidatus Marinimicrobia bacterium]|nr:T9SS type A sorting domain-containing protein [Candidatus Neomarinimicrobiota bacterium]
ILHVEIKLSGDGEQIGLYASDGSTVVDTLTFDAQTTDVSQGRNPDGSETWATFTKPTPGTTNGSAAINEQINLPSTIALEQNYPNPFNPQTTLTYILPEETMVTLVVYDILGKQIKTIVNQPQNAGIHNARWNGTDISGTPVSGGVYLYRMEAGEFTHTLKMLLLK